MMMTCDVHTVTMLDGTPFQKCATCKGTLTECGPLQSQQRLRPCRWSVVGELCIYQAIWCSGPGRCRWCQSLLVVASLT